MIIQNRFIQNCYRNFLLLLKSWTKIYYFMSKKNKNEENDNTGWIIFIAIIVCLLLWIGGMLLSHWYAGKYFIVSENDNPQALFGDSFGAVNALISAFAFAGVIVAIFIQRNELRLQRKDLGLQRQEFSTQNETLKLQRFENTFFNMLSLQQQIVNDLSFTDIDKEQVVEDAPDPSLGKIVKEVIVDKAVKGRELFYYSFVERLHYFRSSDGSNIKVKGMKSYLQYGGLSSYDDSYTPTYFDHYFRHLYTIIKFVDNVDFLSFDEKYKYTSMVRATLSRYELIWLFYNGISSVGKQKFKHLIEEYSLLKNIREDLLTLSKENLNIVTNKRFNQKLLQDNGYSGTDYEFWITDDKDDKEKYYVSAFYNKNEIERGKRKVREWHDFFVRHLQ